MKMKSKKQKKQLLAAAAGLALVAAVAGTFAWISNQDQKINRVRTAAIKDGSVTINEIWEPKPIIPGTSTKKEVTVSNTGAGQVFVRVSYEEILKHLTNKGATIFKDVGWSADTSLGLKDSVPVEFDGKKYIESGSGFTDVTSKVKNSAGVNLPEGVKVYGQGSVTKDPITGAEETTWTYGAFFEYAAGKYQAMDTEISVKDGHGVDKPVGEWNFVATKLKYEIYDQGYTYTVANWAKSSLAGADGQITGAALLGSKGEKGGVSYDYTVEGLEINAIPSPTPAVEATQIPLQANEAKNIQTDKLALNVNGIQIGYGGSITTIDELKAASWVYNKDDGYFYYTNPLGSGATTGTLLDKLIFTNEVGKEFINAEYDLVVKLEAIQGTKEALLDDAGWNLQGKVGDTEKIVKHLENASVIVGATTVNP